MDIYSILASVPHNIHHLKRYFNFIQCCKEVNKNLKAKGNETHHICPKAKDLFPQYGNFSKNPWNKIVLTYRQHFLAHFMLWKAYGGSQLYSFWAMNHQNERRNGIKLGFSKTYANLKKEWVAKRSTEQKGIANYVTSDGTVVKAKTDDPLVLNGEYVAQSKGRKYKPRSQESRNRTGAAHIKYQERTNPIMKQRLYFLDIRIEINIPRYDRTLLESYLSQGWSAIATPEYKTKIGKKGGSRIRTQEEKDKFSIKMKGRKGHPIPVMVEGIRFDSRHEAAKHFGVSFEQITRKIKDPRPEYDNYQYLKNP